MEQVFLITAIFGSTVMIAQILLTLVGLAGHGGDFDHDTGVDAPHDMGDHGGGGHTGDSHDGTHDGSQQVPSHPVTPHAHGSAWLFRVLTFRTISAGLAFFGLGGMAARTSGAAEPWPVILGLGAGLAAMCGVYYLMQALYRLNDDGTQRIGRAVGCEGVVYLTIPQAHTGRGKIHVTVQNRLLELDAVTAGPALPTGSRVIVAAVPGSDTVQVEAIPELARNTHA